MLQPLAYYMMGKHQRMLPIEEAKSVITGPLAQVGAHADPGDFLRLIENGSGLLVERESGLYGFSHLTFQEYLASAHACTARLVDDLVTHVAEDWWRETIRLYAAQADATPIVPACLADARTSVPALALAIECQDEALQLDPSQRATLSDLLDAGIEDDNPDRRRLAAETLLTLRTRHMTRLDDLRETDDSLITHADYQLFIDDMRAQGKFYQPDHWHSYQFPVGQGRDPVVGVRPSDAVAFCDWLTGRMGEGWCYRVPHSAELPPLSRLGILSKAGYWTESNGACSIESQNVLSLDDEALSYLWDARARDLDLDLDRARTRYRARAQVYLDVYVDIFILQGRRIGKLPAFEGIRIVREHRPVEGSSAGAFSSARARRDAADAADTAGQ